LILVSDYAFGHQAESIASALCLLFGTRIRSFNIIGKAGGLEGARGDIVLASQLVKQRDNLITVIANEGLDATRIQQQSGCPVRTGAVLTVDGTVIQDRNLLLFYKEFFDCISLEMEGSYYARNLLANKELGLVGNVALRFLVRLFIVRHNQKGNNIITQMVCGLCLCVAVLHFRSSTASWQQSLSRNAAVRSHLTSNRIFVCFCCCFGLDTANNSPRCIGTVDGKEFLRCMPSPEPYLNKFSNLRTKQTL
jgi:hypothetical protein